MLEPVMLVYHSDVILSPYHWIELRLAYKQEWTLQEISIMP